MAQEARREGQRELSPHWMAFRLALVYFLVGGSWVLFSDWLLAQMGLPVVLERYIASTKGAAFVLVTSLVLYAVSRAGLTRVRTAQRSVRDQELRIRQAYVDVLDAVTGGKLLLVTGPELGQRLGRPLVPPTPIGPPDRLSEVRHAIRDAASEVVPEPRVEAAVTAAGEALNNAIIHAGSGEYGVFSREGRVQVEVKDSGPGIDFAHLPRATLLPGFSTTHTLGLGFTLMLQLADRVFVCTEPGSTSVLIEC